MAAALEQSTKRFIGTSADGKPTPSADALVPAGSSFLETDTGRIFRFDGVAWAFAGMDTAAPADTPGLAVLQAILGELRRLREYLELTTSD